MYCGLSVSVVIPAYNEERFIAGTLRRIPHFVDDVVVVDDSSLDRTVPAAEEIGDDRVRIVRHTTNRGVGGAILTGYREVLTNGAHVAVVMAGDGQMDPEDLPRLLDPIAEGRADYVKGNRFLHLNTFRIMPALRQVGNLGLSLLTRLTSGYGHIMDSQCGYTAVTTDALRRLDFSRVYPRYGFPNDLLAHLHTLGCHVGQVKVRAIYEGQDSGINPLLSVAPLSYVLLRSLVMRLRRELGRAS